MSSVVTVAPATGSDGYSKPTYGTAVRYRAHLSNRPVLARSANGQEVVAGLSVYLNTTDVIAETSQVTLSTGDVGSTDDDAIHPPISAVERRFDGRGAHHVVLRLGRLGSRGAG